MAGDVPDFYRNQGEIINKGPIIGEMKSKYDRFLNAYLQKTFEEGTDKGLLQLVKANGDNINFRVFLDYLLKNNPENLNNDDLYQLAALRNDVVNLREEIEDMGPRDFQIVEGNIGDYRFMGSDSFEYMGNNFYAVKVDFSKIRDHRVNSWLNIETTYRRGDKFFIQYDGNNVIKYYSGRSQNNMKLLGHEVIDHKQETIVRGGKIYNRGAVEDIYLRKLGMNLKIKFFEKRKTD
ncbi:MAG: hypothetical protein PHV23_03430 [Candidatus Gracilibacteria bacterium]|nr:hypothetical protein [Candidatus Gracilibacteria bacterium]